MAIPIRSIPQQNSCWPTRFGQSWWPAFSIGSSWIPADLLVELVGCYPSCVLDGQR